MLMSGGREWCMIIKFKFKKNLGILTMKNVCLSCIFSVANAAIPANINTEFQFVSLNTFLMKKSGYD